MFSIELWENLVDADTFIEGLTGLFSKWKHSTRSVGGNWFGEGEYIGPTTDMEVFFLTNLGRRIKVTGGGIAWWEGQIVRMEYTHQGQTFVRSMEDMANRTKVIYSKIGDNLLPLGDVESGSWVKVSTPSTYETTTDWFAKGPTAMHIISDNVGEGARPHADSTVTISASTAYDCGMIVDVDVGPWTLQVDDGAGGVIASRATSGSGRAWLQCQVPNSNDDTTVRVKLLSSGAGNEVYADGAVLYTSPLRCETQWFSDADSIEQYGRIEGVYLEREMSDAEATGAAQRELTENAWPRTEPVQRGRSLGFQDLPEGQMPDPRRKPRPDRLIVTCMGMNWTLGWRYALTEGTANADSHITNLIDESEFIASSNALIDDNSAEVFLESTNPVTIWRQIEKCIDVGDGAGTSWMGGTYPGREFRFEERHSDTHYEFHRGQMRYNGGGAVIPLEFQPGWCRMLDMPAEPTPAGGSDDDDPRRVWLDETWFIHEKGITRLDWTRERD